MATGTRVPHEAYAEIMGTFFAGLAAGAGLQAGSAALAHKSDELEQRSDG